VSAFKWLRDSSFGLTFLSIVPGGTVLLMTTSVPFFIVFPTSSRAFIRKERFGFLFLSIGVCTEITTVSAWVRTSEFNVAFNLPA